MSEKRNSRLISPRRTILKTITLTGAMSLGSTGAVAQATDRDVWVFDVGNLVVSSPTVVEDTLYVGSNGSDVYAINKSTGDKKWIFETGEFVNSSPAVVNDTVYIGSNDNNVYAIDRNTGKKRWEFDTGDKIRSSPTFSNGTVFIGNGDFRDPTDTAVYAINADSGQKEWRYEVGDRVSSAPIVDKEVVYVTSTDGKLYALNTMDGSLNWSKDIGAGRGSPTIVNETVYAPGFDGVFALNKETGSEQWKYEEEVSFISNSPTVANNILYIGFASANKLLAIDIDSGNKIWEFSTGNKVYSSPTYTNETIFVGNENGNVFSIDANTGDENWRVSVGDETGSSPIVVDGTLYIGSVERDPYGGSVYAIDTDVSGSSNGSRANFGTLGHNEEWLGEAAGVDLRNVKIDPETVDGTTETHTLTFDVVNLSADDGRDDFNIAMPTNVEVSSVSITRSDGLELTPPDPDPSNPIEFSVDPREGDITDPPVNFEVKLELSPADD